ncbi:MAG: hypothetical protein J6Z40_01495 [Oscillospiraceae bacterium]|nr:hypothetical protein [Oscillospiraceae bacterium]MBQ5337824.1 hypothetical protein [Oscillospiraceae bacterium]
MKHFRKFLAVMISACLLTGCGSTAQNSGTESAEHMSSIPEEKSLVTLGDSISFGYGMEDVTTQRYSAYLAEKLHSRDKLKWNDYNYAVSGDNSSDLIRKLNNGRALHAPSADAIILYIGANNLLGAYGDYIIEKAEEKGIDVSHPESLTDEELEDIQKQFEDEMQDTDAVKEAVQKKIDENLAQLDADLETIYQWIRERNDKADVYVLNIYNPYPKGLASDLIPENTDLAGYAQSQIDRANEIIADLTAKHDDLIPVDIAAAFAACDPLPVIGTANAETTDGDAFEYYDPHPNAEGQKIIADAVWKVMEPRK